MDVPKSEEEKRESCRKIQNGILQLKEIGIIDRQADRQTENDADSGVWSGLRTCVIFIGSNDVTCFVNVRVLGEGEGEYMN